jgi:hypothetical protein
MGSGGPVKFTSQKGIVVLILVIILALGAIAYLLSGFSAEEIKHYQLVATNQSLNQAKDALLAYAATRADIALPSKQQGEYGFLPCPETFKNGTEGNSAGTCGKDNRNTIGWLPWKSLGLPPLEDNSGTCLLYAVSASYKKEPSYAMLNEDTNGMFQVVDHSGAIVEGANPDDRVVAIIFAPGKELPGQSRNFSPGSICGEDYGNYAAYLDVGGVGGTINNSDVVAADDLIDQFIHATAESTDDAQRDPYNDRFVTITRDEIWTLVRRRADFVKDPSSKIRRMTEALAQCIAAYGNTNSNRWLPMPALEGLAGNDYRNNVSYDDDGGANHRGRYPYIVDTADTIIPGTSAGSILFDKGICSALPIQWPLGPNADLSTTTMSEDRVMWEHWKDHVFYAVSDAYDPKPLPLVPDPIPRCGPCLKVNGLDYAAVVIYGNTRLAGQTREAPIAPMDIDTKNNYKNYIELTNADTAGAGDFTPTKASNDILYCITDTEPLGVIPCP